MRVRASPSQRNLEACCIRMSLRSKHIEGALDVPSHDAKCVQNQVSEHWWLHPKKNNIENISQASAIYTLSGGNLARPDHVTYARGDMSSQIKCLNITAQRVYQTKARTNRRRIDFVVHEKLAIDVVRRYFPIKRPKILFKLSEMNLR